MTSRICFARVDRIGDLILTLPCETAWKEYRPNDQIEWLVTIGLKPVIDHAEGVSPAFFVSTPSGLMEQLRSALRLRKILMEKNFSEVLCFHVPWWVAFAFYLAGVPRRVGPASQWFSWIFFNGRLRQKRSDSIKHESKYNLDLVSFALGKALEGIVPTKLRLPSSNSRSNWARNLEKAGANLSRLIVIHPGMGGSARNWSAENYLNLSKNLLSQGFSIVVTGSEFDRAFVEKIGLLELKGVISFLGKTDLEDILSILSFAQTVIAPSTGIAHLAAALGVRLVAIYCPVQVQAPRRWRPLGSKDLPLQVRVFVPEVICPGKYRCLGRACEIYDCMTKIDVDSVLAYVIQR